MTPQSNKKQKSYQTIIMVKKNLRTIRNRELTKMPNSIPERGLSLSLDQLDRPLLHYLIDLDDVSTISQRLQNIHKDLTVRTMIVLASEAGVQRLFEEVRSRIEIILL